MDQTNENKDKQLPQEHEKKDEKRFGSVLSDTAIVRHMQLGTVVIHPYKRENLCTSSYDVTLGEYYYREVEPPLGASLYNPYSEQMVKRVWGEVKLATSVAELKKQMVIKEEELEGIKPDDRIIMIGPGETILAHTNEFIGGKKTITTMMKARSSLGRNFVNLFIFIFIFYFI